MQLPPARGCYQLAPQRTFTSNPVPMPGTPARAAALRAAPGTLKAARAELGCTTQAQVALWLVTEEGLGDEDAAALAALTGD